MEMQQKLIEATIKIEIAEKDEGLSNVDMRSNEHTMLVNDIKNEEAAVSDPGDGLEESQFINMDFVKHEELKLPDMPDNFSSVKYEIKSEEIDITYPSTSLIENFYIKNSSLLSTATITTAPSDRYCDGDSKDSINMELERNCNLNSQETEKQWRKIKLNQMSTGPHGRKNISFDCSHCDFSTTTRKYLMRHMLRLHSANFKKHLCAGCEKHFTEKKSLDDHIIKKHQNLIDLVNRKVYSCPTCDYKTTKKFQLKQHTMKVHLRKDEKYLCTDCEKRFKDKTSLDDHIIKTHQHLIDSMVRKIRSCPTCDYETTVKSDFKDCGCSHLVKLHN